MTESEPHIGGEDAAAARAAEQARLRKERREARIKSGGTARLNKITGLGGGLQRDVPPDRPAVATSPASTPPRPAAADPEEVDISQHFFTPNTTPRRAPAPAATAANNMSDMSEAQLRQLMLGFEPPAPGGPSPFLGGGNVEEDPMFKLLSGMMGGSNPFGGAAAAAGGGGAFPAPAQPPNAGPALPDRYAALWRLVHFAVALGLGLYIAIFTPFTGSKQEREQSALEHSLGHVTEQDVFKQYFFYAFATAETLLLTTRFFLDRSRAPPSGILWTLVGFLPGKARTYVEVGLRQAQILSTVRSDILVTVFVLGVCAWFRSY